MQCSHSDWCSFVVLHFVHDIFSFIHMCASVFWEENNTNWQVTVNKSLNVYLIFITVYEVLLNKQVKRLTWTDLASSFKTVLIKHLFKNYF